MIVELNGTAVNPEDVIGVKKSQLGEATQIFFRNQGELRVYTRDLSYEEVVSRINAGADTLHYRAIRVAASGSRR